jgi:hypothetical protein
MIGCLTRRVALIALAMSAISSSACTRNPYVIGALCAGGGKGVDGGAGDARCPAQANGATFAADFDRSGAAALEPLELPGGKAAAAFTLRGERATSASWPTDEGPALARGAGVPAVGVPAPFTDGTGAVDLDGAAPSYAAALGAVGGDDFVLETVLRAAPGASLADRRAGGAGWALATDAAGALTLTIAGAAQAVTAAAPISAGAWVHCLAWASRAAGARVDCNGRAGALVPLAAQGDLDGAASLSLGGGAPARVARLSLTRVPPGGLGDPAGWSVISARRFATLTGARPKVAAGSAAPRAGVRDAPAYLDLQAIAGGPRRLFLVGQDWPRIACRTDAAGQHGCGYLSEPLRTRRVPADARAWTNGAGLTLVPQAATVAAEGPPLVALVPAAANGPHVLAVDAPDTDARHVLSFFARAGSLARVSVQVGARSAAVYDLRAGTIATAPTEPFQRATIEPWGDELYRCTYAYAGTMGTVTHALRLVDGAGAQAFAGDGATPAIFVAGLQLDLGYTLATSLLAADPQPPDRLAFLGDDGNLPAGPVTSMAMRVLLPEGPRLTDEAIVNLNQGGGYENQVNVFVRGDQGRAKFWGLRGGDTHWTFDHPASMIDGVLHAITASWDATSARIAIDGAAETRDATLPNTPPFVFDRIDVGFSESSSGALEGLVAGLQIGAP